MLNKRLVLGRPIVITIRFCKENGIFEFASASAASSGLCGLLNLAAEAINGELAVIEGTSRLDTQHAFSSSKIEEQKNEE